MPVYGDSGNELVSSFPSKEWPEGILEGIFAHVFYDFEAPHEEKSPSHVKGAAMDNIPMF